jgi:hypothetical protein
VFAEQSTKGDAQVRGGTCRRASLGERPSVVDRRLDWCDEGKGQGD